MSLRLNPSRVHFRSRHRGVETPSVRRSSCRFICRGIPRGRRFRRRAYGKTRVGCRSRRSPVSSSASTPHPRGTCETTGDSTTIGRLLRQQPLVIVRQQRRHRDATRHHVVDRAHPASGKLDPPAGIRRFPVLLHARPQRSPADAYGRRHRGQFRVPAAFRTRASSRRVRSSTRARLAESIFGDSSVVTSGSGASPV